MDFSSKKYPELPHTVTVRNLAPEKRGSGISCDMLPYSGLQHMADVQRTHSAALNSVGVLAY